MKKYYFFCCALLLAFTAMAQDTVSIAPTTKKKRKGSFYLTWGYQRNFYSNSTIHFKDTQTDNYDFTIHNASAIDRLDINKGFLGKEPITVPQYVAYAGYFFGNKGNWGIEVGWDHLKYIVRDYQYQHLEGQIHGKHYDLDTVISPSMVHYEHTNGNNYLMASVIKKNYFYQSPKKNHQLSLIPKLGVGVLIPKTYSVMFGHENDGPFRPSGYVIAAAGSLRYDFFKYLFIEHTVKGGFANYTNAKLWGAGRANHHFWSVQYIFSFGCYITLGN